jgi:hypothetical protein
MPMMVQEFQLSNLTSKFLWHVRADVIGGGVTVIAVFAPAGVNCLSWSPAYS